MHDVIYKFTIGTGGFIATIELGNVNELSLIEAFDAILI